MHHPESPTRDGSHEPLALEVSSLSIRFGTGADAVTAANDVSMAVAAGKTVALLGPSGCGKTSVLRAIAGFVTPDAGTIRCFGREVSAPGRDRVVVFQEHNLFPWLTVRGNVEFALRPSIRRRRDRHAVVEEWIERVQLVEAADRYPSQLSGGMRQRAALARSLAPGSPVMLMDEPFAALDAQTRTEMQVELARLVNDEGRTVVFVTHDVDEALLVADELLVMAANPGEIIGRIPNPFSAPRTTAIFDNAAYGHTKAHVTELIRDGKRREPKP